VNRAGISRELRVDKARLQQELSDLLAAGAVIERIEPQRKDMEAFLLDVLADDPAVKN